MSKNSKDEVIMKTMEEAKKNFHLTRSQEKKLISQIKYSFDTFSERKKKTKLGKDKFLASLKIWLDCPFYVVVNESDSAATINGTSETLNVIDQLSETFAQSLQIDEPVSPSPSLRKEKKKRGPRKRNLKTLKRTGIFNRAKKIIEAAEYDSDLLLQATMYLLKLKNKGLHSIIKFSINKSQQQLQEMLLEFKKNSSLKTEKFTPVAAIDFTHNNKLSHNTFVKILQTFKQRHINVFPSIVDYNEERHQCYPENITATKSYVGTTIDNVVIHTVQRTFKAYREEIAEIMSKHPDLDVFVMTYIMQYGFDGLSDTKKYQLRGKEDTNDNNMISSTLTYLRLVTADNELIFDNRCPGSVRYNRPIAIEFAKETTEKAVDLYNTYESDLKKVQKLEFTENGKKVSEENQMCGECFLSN